MKKGKVAIYMCCYNHEKYVAEAIETVINQTYDNWEFWIANDGSTDRSAEIIASYEDERIHFFDFKENTKIVGAQTCLLDQIRESDCEYIVGTNSDDKWKLDRLEKQVKVLEENDKIGACFSWDEMIFEEGAENDSYKGLENYSHQKNRSRYDWVYYFGIYDNCMNGCSAMIRKDIYFELGGYNQYFIRLGDYRLWLLIAMNYPIYMIEEPLLYYRRHGKNISLPSRKTTLATINEMLVVKKDLFEALSKHDFYRTFYRNLIFTEPDNEEAYFADELFLMMNIKGYAGVFDQIVSGMWLRHSDDKRYMEVLRSRYEMDNFTLGYLNENSGVGPMLLETFGNNDTYSFETEGIEKQIIKKFAGGRINDETFYEYSWNSLYMLALFVMGSEKGEQLFSQIKDEFYKLRMKRINSKPQKIMHIISDCKYQEDAIGLAQSLADEYKVYISVVNTKEANLLNENSVADIGAVQGVEYTDIYDSVNGGIFFDHEIGIQPDIIWYIGCIGDEYECKDMVRGYSLGISQMAMIEQNAFGSEYELKAIEKVLDSVEYL